MKWKGNIVFFFFSFSHEIEKTEQMSLDAVCIWIFHLCFLFSFVSRVKSHLMWNCYWNSRMGEMKQINEISNVRRFEAIEDLKLVNLIEIVRCAGSTQACCRFDWKPDMQLHCCKIIYLFIIVTMMPGR